MIRILRSEHPEYDAIIKESSEKDDFLGLEINAGSVWFIQSGDREKIMDTDIENFLWYPGEEQWVKEHFPEAFI